MSRVLHFTHVGRLSYDEETKMLRVGDCNPIDDLLLMDGMLVQLDVIAYDSPNSRGDDPESPPPGVDFLKKLMGDGPAAG
jgi:hypothetical protein